MRDDERLAADVRDHHMTLRVAAVVDHPSARLRSHGPLKRIDLQGAIGRDAERYAALADTLAEVEAGVRWTVPRYDCVKWLRYSGHEKSFGQSGRSCQSYFAN